MQRYDVLQVASTYSKLIKPSDIDLTCIGLPPPHHAEWALRAVRAEKLVPCEKPFAMKAHEAQPMASAKTAATRLPR